MILHRAALINSFMPDHPTTLHEIARRRWRLAGALSLFVAVIYFGFILLIAFDKPLLATRIAPGLSLGILLGALVIVASWLATWIYVRWANGPYDRIILTLRGEQSGEQK
jgi:uncharacterized membrane protein (DUF485 family)